MDNVWLLKYGTLGVVLSAALGVLYGLVTLSRCPEEH